MGRESSFLANIGQNSNISWPLTFQDFQWYNTISKGSVHLMDGQGISIRLHKYIINVLKHIVMMG